MNLRFNFKRYSIESFLMAISGPEQASRIMFKGYSLKFQHKYANGSEKRAAQAKENPNNQESIRA